MKTVARSLLASVLQARGPYLRNCILESAEHCQQVQAKAKAWAERLITQTDSTATLKTAPMPNSCRELSTTQDLALVVNNLHGFMAQVINFSNLVVLVQPQPLKYHFCINYKL